MSTRVRFDVPILRPGSAPLMLDVEADVIVDDRAGLTRVIVVSLRFGDWEWDYLLELARLAFRHSRLAWSGARAWAAAIGER